MSAIDNLIDASVRCVACGAPFGKCAHPLPGDRRDCPECKQDAYLATLNRGKRWVWACTNAACMWFANQPRPKKYKP
jgi:hypothetical protein